MKKAQDVMANDVVTANPEMSVAAAGKLMLEQDIGCLVVIENGRIAGIITDRDLMHCGLEGHNIQTCPISTYMSTPVVTAEPEVLIINLAKVMATRQIKRVPITNKGELVGIISFSDIAREMDEQTAEMWSEWLELIAITKTSAKHCRGRRFTRKDSTTRSQGRRLGWVGLR